MNKDPDLIRAENDSKRLELEQSFARKWAPTIISGLATICIGIMSFAGTQIADIQAKKDKKIANDQVALAMYFDHIVDQDQCSPATARSVKLIEAITENREIELVLNNITDCVIKDAIQQQQEAPVVLPMDPSISPRLMGPLLVEPKAETALAPQEALPNLIDPNSEYTLSQFTAYIQAPASKVKQAQQLEAALKELGLRVPGVDIVEHPTAENEIRFYQQGDFDRFGEQLKMIGMFGFKTTVLSGDYPHGIIEFWIGK